jgi:hypothetical protein
VVSCPLGRLESDATATVEMVVQLEGPTGELPSHTARAATRTVDPNGDNDATTVPLPARRSGRAVTVLR